MKILRGWASFSRRDMCRPIFRVDWMDNRGGYVDLSWGHPGSDPIWSIGFDWEIGERLGQLVDWWYARAA